MTRSLAPLLLIALLTGCATPLLKAVHARDHALAGKLLAEGANPDKGSLDHPPLMDAVWMGDVEMARLLFDAGAKDKTLNLLYQAVDSGNPKMVDLLVERGYDLEASRGAGDMNTLGWAVYVGKAKMARYLLEKGVDPLSARAGLDYFANSKVDGWQKRGKSAIAMLDQLTGAAAPAAAPAAVRPAASPRSSVSSEVDTPSYRVPENPADFAVIVGIDEYKDLPRAEFAERDADAVRAHIEALGVPKRHIVLLKGENATRTGFAKYLEEWLPRNVKPASRVFFYYSGHGAPDAATGKAYLVPWDGDASFLKSTAYPVEKLYASLHKLKVKQIVVALDACFSGAGGRSVLAKGARPLMTKIDAALPPEGNIALLTAASGEEITTTLENEGHGIFTYFFLKGLNGAAANAGGAVTANGLYEYLRPKVQDEARLQNREQTPTFQASSNPVLRNR